MGYLELSFLFGIVQFVYANIRLGVLCLGELLWKMNQLKKVIVK